jgi:hypothetical protein
MTVRIPEVESSTCGTVELIRWAIIAQPVAPIVGKPEFFGFRMPVKTHRVSNTVGKNFQPRSVGPHTQQRGITLVCRPASVTGCSNRNIKPTVGSKGNKSPTVTPILGQVVQDKHGLGGISETRFDVLVTPHTVGLRDVKIPVPKNNPVGSTQSAGQGENLLRFLVSVPIQDGVDGTFTAGAYEQGALGAQRHGASTGDASSVNVDLKSWRKFKQVQSKLLVAAGWSLTHQHRPQAYSSPGHHYEGNS